MTILWYQCPYYVCEMSMGSIPTRIMFSFQNQRRSHLDHSSYVPLQHLTGDKSIDKMPKVI